MTTLWLNNSDLRYIPQQNTAMSTKTCVYDFIAPLFVIVKIRTQATYLLKEWIKKLWSTDTMESYSEKKNEMLQERSIHASTLMNFKNVYWLEEVKHKGIYTVSYP